MRTTFFFRAAVAKMFVVLFVNVCLAMRPSVSSRPSLKTNMKSAVLTADGEAYVNATDAAIGLDYVEALDNTTDSVTDSSTGVQALLAHLADYVENEVPKAELDEVRGYSLLEAHGIPIKQSFGWFVLQQQAYAGQSLAMQTSPEASALLQEDNPPLPEPEVWHVLTMVDIFSEQTLDKKKKKAQAQPGDIVEGNVEGDWFHTKKLDEKDMDGYIKMKINNQATLAKEEDDSDIYDESLSANRGAEIDNMFALFDKDGNKELDANELAKMLKFMGLPYAGDPKELKEDRWIDIPDSGDWLEQLKVKLGRDPAPSDVVKTRKDGDMAFSKFQLLNAAEKKKRFPIKIKIAALLDAKGALNKDRKEEFIAEQTRRIRRKTIEDAFTACDTNGDRQIGPGELLTMMQRVGSKDVHDLSNAQAMLTRLGSRQNGKLPLNDFVNALESSQTDDSNKLYFAILHLGKALTEKQINEDLQNLNKGNIDDHLRRVLSPEGEALGANLDPRATDDEKMNEILREYLEVEGEDGETELDKEIKIKGRKTPLSEEDSEKYKLWRQKERLTKPSWFIKEIRDSKEKDRVAVLHDRAYALYMKTNEWLEYVNEHEASSWEDLESQSLAHRLWETVQNKIHETIHHYRELFNRGKKFVQRMWVKFRSAMRSIFLGCAAETHKIQNEAMTKGLDGTVDDTTPLAKLTDQLKSAGDNLAEQGNGADAQMEQLKTAVGQAKLSGEKLEKASKALSQRTDTDTTTKVEEAAKAAQENHARVAGAEHAACQGGIKGAAKHLSDLIRKITTEAATAQLPDIGLRGLGGSVSVLGGGFEEVVDFKNKEIGYFAGNGIVIGASSAGVTVTGYAGLGYKGEEARKDWPLDISYRASVFGIFRLSTAFPIAPLLNGTASLGVGFKLAADESVSPWQQDKGGMKIAMFGASVGGAATGQGKVGVSVEYGADKYRYITSECFEKNSDFIPAIWKFWCTTCGRASLEATKLNSELSDERKMFNLGAMRAAVHAVSFPIITDLVFTFLAHHWEEKRNKAIPVNFEKTCSMYSVQNRNNAPRLATLAQHYVSETKKHLALLRFHIKRLEDNFNNLQEENAAKGLLTQHKKTREIFMHMASASCRRFPFEGPVGEYLYNEKKQEEHPVMKELLGYVGNKTVKNPTKAWVKNALTAMSSTKEGQVKIDEFMRKFNKRTAHKWSLGTIGKSMSKKVETLADAIIAKNAIAGEYPLGACTKPKQCQLPHTTCDKPENSVQMKCMCKPGYCYRMKKLTDNRYQFECKKHHGLHMKKSINALLAWVRRTELRLGLIIFGLKALGK